MWHYRNDRDHYYNKLLKFEGLLKTSRLKFIYRFTVSEKYKVVLKSFNVIA